VLGGLAEVSDKGLTVMADVATTLEELDRGKVRRHDFRHGGQARRERRLGARPAPIERLDHFKSIQKQLMSTGRCINAACRVRHPELKATAHREGR